MNQAAQSNLSLPLDRIRGLPRGKNTERFLIAHFGCSIDQAPDRTGSVFLPEGWRVQKVERPNGETAVVALDPKNRHRVLSQIGVDGKEVYHALPRFSVGIRYTPRGDKQVTLIDGQRHEHEIISVPRGIDENLIWHWGQKAARKFLPCIDNPASYWGGKKSWLNSKLGRIRESFTNAASADEHIGAHLKDCLKGEQREVPPRFQIGLHRGDDHQIRLKLYDTQRHEQRNLAALEKGESRGRLLAAADRALQIYMPNYIDPGAYRELNIIEVNTLAASLTRQIERERSMGRRGAKRDKINAIRAKEAEQFDF